MNNYNVGQFIQVICNKAVFKIIEIEGVRDARCRKTREKKPHLYFKGKLIKNPSNIKYSMRHGVVNGVFDLSGFQLYEVTETPLWRLLNE